MTDVTQAGPAPERGPLVPPEWVPAPQAPARRERPPWWKVLAAVAGVLALLGAIGWGVVTLYDSFGNASPAKVELAARAARAAVANDTTALRDLIPAATVRAIPDERWRTIDESARPMDVEWGRTVREAGRIETAFRIEGEKHSLIVEPHGQDPDRVRVTVVFPGGERAEGMIRLVAEGGSWKLLSIHVGDEGTSFAPQDAGAVTGW